jgi:hypothetical protein
LCHNLLVQLKADAKPRCKYKDEARMIVTVTVALERLDNSVEEQSYRMRNCEYIISTSSKTEALIILLGREVTKSLSVAVQFWSQIFGMVYLN